MPPPKCPECSQTKFQTNDSKGEVICRNCGLVLEDSPTEHMPLERNQASHPALARAGTYQYNGRIVRNSWFLSTREKNFQAGLSKIELLASSLKIPARALDETKLIFKRALEHNLAVGRDYVTLAYASVYAACQLNGVPKTALEIVAFSEISKAKLLRAHSIVKETLGLRIQTTDPADLLPRFASKLQLEPATVTLAAEILMNVKEQGIGTGKKPESILAGAMYLACQKNGDRRTQRQIANTIGVIEVTIRKIKNEINMANSQ